MSERAAGRAGPGGCGTGPSGIARAGAGELGAAGNQMSVFRRLVWSPAARGDAWRTFCRNGVCQTVSAVVLRVPAPAHAHVLLSTGRGDQPRLQGQPLGLRQRGKSSGAAWPSQSRLPLGTRGALFPGPFRLGVRGGSQAPLCQDRRSESWIQLPRCSPGGVGTRDRTYTRVHREL